MVDQGRTTVVERLERDGLLIQGTILPTPREETAPLACQSAHGGLRRFPLVALLLGIPPRPEGMPERCGGPRAAWLPEALGTRAAPVPPGLLAAAFGDGREPRLFVPCGGGGRAFPVCAAGDEPPGGTDGSRPWERRAQGAIRRALRALRAGGLTGGKRLQGDPELGAKRLDEPGLGGDNACIGGQGGGRLAGV
jgi:hypothetical protein